MYTEQLLERLPLVSAKTLDFQSVETLGLSAMSTYMKGYVVLNQLALELKLQGPG